MNVKCEQSSRAMHLAMQVELLVASVRPAGRSWPYKSNPGSSTQPDTAIAETTLVLSAATTPSWVQAALVPCVFVLRPLSELFK